MESKIQLCINAMTDLCYFGTNLGGHEEEY